MGGDDKAGISIIVTFLQELNQLVKSNQLNLEKMPSICVCFTPDEEIGNGTAKIDLEKLKKTYKNVFALTIDGEREHEISVETFNAYSYQICIKGYNIHPG